MKTIGVISDTHGLLRPEAQAALADSDLILHAGDVGELAILERLAEIAPVWAVRGNTDYGEVAARLRLNEVVDLLSATGEVDPEAVAAPTPFLSAQHPAASSPATDPSLTSQHPAASSLATGPPPPSGTPGSWLAYLHHGHHELDLDPAASGIRLVVSGHTHLPHLQEANGVLYLNPGSAGPRRFTQPVTVARIKLDEDLGTLTANIVELL